MEKALEILKLFQSDKYKFESGAPLWKSELDSKMKEAIAELEEAMKPKTCEGCKHYLSDSYYENTGCCSLGVGSGYCVHNTVDNTFCCNRYEPKDTQR